MSLAAYAPLLDEIRRVRWSAVRRVSGATSGVHLSRVRGTSAEFVEYRGYRPGDDPRRLDWRLLARSDRAYIRLSLERALLPTAIVLDASASMAFPADSSGKWVLARQLGVALAAVARNGGDPVGMTVVHGAERRVVAPRTRRSVLDEMVRAAEIVPAGSPPLAAAASEAARRCARLVVVTDFLGDADALLGVVRTFVAAGGEAHAVHIVDARELEPDRGRLLVTDPEEPTIRRPLVASARAEYERRFAEWRQMLAQAWRGSGVSLTLAVAGRDAPGRLVRRIAAPPGRLAGVPA